MIHRCQNVALQNVGVARIVRASGLRRLAQNESTGVCELCHGYGVLGIINPSLMKLRLPLVSVVASAVLATCAWADFHDHLGLQMWSLRATTLAKGFPASLDLTKEWGIKEVEGGGSVGTMTPAQVRAALDAHGLTSPSMHVGYEILTKDVSAVIRDAKVIGATMVICPWVPHKGDFNAATTRNKRSRISTSGVLRSMPPG